MSNDLSNLSAIKSSVENGDWKVVEDFFNQSEQSRHLGILLNLDNPDTPVCEVPDILPFHLGGVGQKFVNGGIISAVVDIAIGLTAIKHLPTGLFATSKLSIDLTRPVEGKRFYAVSKINRQIGKTIFSESTVFNYKDEPCVFATGSVRIGIDSAVD